MPDGTLDLADFLQSSVVHSSDPAEEIQKLEPPFPGLVLFVREGWLT
jgi:hypothetical protein